MSIIRDILPDIVPDDDILVKGEEHDFKTTEYRDGTSKSQQRYVIDKAPVVNVKEVYDDSQTFVEGEDYEVVENNTIIDFAVGGESPEENSKFYITYVSRSIIDRYIEAHEEIIDEVDDKSDNAISANFIDEAEGVELDEIGKLFGELGRRRGREDQEYKVNLKSIVESFNGRGTVQGIKFAVSSGLGVSPDNITVNEDFENTSYKVEVRDFGDLEETNLSTINDLVELADPSGVELELLTFIFGPAISSFEGTDEVDYVLETPRVTHTDDGDRVQIDVNSVLTAEEDVFTADEENANTDVSRLQTDKVATSAWNTGASLNIDVYRDGETEVGDQNKIRDTKTDTKSSTDESVEDIQEIDLALAGVGIGNVDYTDDGSTSDWEPESVDTRTDTELSSDESSQSLQQLDIAHYQDGSFGIDVQNLLSSKTEIQSSDAQSTYDSFASQIDEVQVASIDSGRGQTDVSFDPKTKVIGDDPDSFEETNTEENTDDTVYNTQQIDVAHYQDGTFNIDIQNILGSNLDVSTNAISSFKEEVTERIDEVKVASIDSGRGQTDVSFDPNTEVIGEEPSVISENDVQSNTENVIEEISPVEVALAQSSPVSIDVNTVLSESLNISENDTQSFSEETRNKIEELKVASIESGRWQIDVSLDPNTVIIGRQPENFEEVNTAAFTTESTFSTQEVFVATSSYGIGDVHVTDDGSTDAFGSPVVFETGENHANNDLSQQTLNEVQELYVNEGRVNVDTTEA